MNTATHRLIFNQTRGCLMPVAETARSIGKGRGSGRKLKTRACPRSSANPIASNIYESNRPLAPVAYAQAAINSIAIDSATNDQGSNVQITATGADPAAGNNVQLKASKDINIVSAQDTEAHQTDHSDWTVGAGVGVAASSSGGASLGITANVGVGVATQKSQASTQINSHITAGNNLSVESSRDTNIAGGVLSADSVSADVGRNLNIASQQDTASASAKSASASVSATVGYGVSVSVSLAYAKSQNDFASVDEQSGIRAGNGGFNINVKGNTDLKGGVISSTQAAVDAGKNSLTTATLTSSDIANHSTADGIGLSASASYSAGGSNQTKDDNGKTITGTGPGGTETTNQGNAGAKMGAASMGAASESDSSTTRSGISGATLTIGTKTTRTDQGQTATDSSGKAINTGVTTGVDTTAKLAKPSSLEDIQAQVQIVQSFGSQASKAVGDYAGKKYDELTAQARNAKDPAERQALQDEAAKWDEGGIYRSAAHAVVGGLTGGASGAAGAGAAALSADAINKATADLPSGVKSAVGAAIAAGIGGVAGGGSVTGVSAALNEDLNNRQLHETEVQRIKALANGDVQKEARLTAAACAMVGCANGVPTDDPSYAYLKALQDAGASLANEKTLLTQQKGWEGRSYGSLFQYTGVDQYIIDPLTQNKAGTRALGAVQTVAGAAGVAGSGVLCASGGGCMLGAVTGTVSADYALAGAKQVVSGNAAQPYGEQVLQSLGLSPQAAAITYAALGITPAAVDAVIVNKAAGEAAKYNILAKASYADFTPQGIKATDAVMATPQVQSLINEISAGSRGLPIDKAEQYAAKYVETGATLPQPTVATPGSVLIKAVPAGETPSAFTGYWMTPQQAQAISSMAPEQAGRLLGLPATQAANMLQGGMDFFVMSPKPGAAPVVFTSEVAQTTQGAAVMPGGATQIIVPNRALWTDPVPITPANLKSTTLPAKPGGKP